MLNHEQDLKAVLNLLRAPAEAMGQFLRYHDLLLEWNRRMNLISRQDEARIVKRHFIESLALLQFADMPLKTRLLDIGSGAGFPGIPIKICRPDIQVTLMDSTRKKGLFLNYLIEELDLSDAYLIIGRAERPPVDKPVADIVISRAVSDTATIVEWSVPYLNPAGGRIILPKGPGAQNELNHLLARVSTLSISASRHATFVPFSGLIPGFQLSLIEIRTGNK